MNHVIRSFSTLTLIVCAVAFASAQRTQSLQLGHLLTEALGVNDKGEVVGYRVDSLPLYQSTDDGWHLANGNLYVVDYPSPNDPYVYKTWARAINNLGQIVGSYQDTSLVTHGFLDASGVFSSLDFPGASYTLANGINDSGTIVGYYIDPSGYHGFQRVGTTYSTIAGPSGNAGSWAYGINNAGHIVGAYYGGDCGFDMCGYLLVGTTYTKLVSPDMWATGSMWANAISNAGVVAGYFDEYEGGMEHGFTYSAGTYDTFDFPGSEGDTRVYGINKRGLLVGDGIGIPAPAEIYKP